MTRGPYSLLDMYINMRFVIFLQNDASEIKSDGNMFFSKLCGAQIYCIKKSKDEMCGEDDDYETVFKPRMEKLAQKIK